MEKFAVDLDKVLDEFELNEDRAHELTAGQEEKPSGYREFLIAASENAFSFNEGMVPLIDSMPEMEKPSSGCNSASVRYDFPFEPTERINLSEADFSAAPRKPFQAESLPRSGNAPTPASGKKMMLNRLNNDDGSQLRTTSAAVSPTVGHPHGGGGVSNGTTFQFGEVANGNDARRGEADPPEYSADRLMKDIETVMGTETSLQVLKQGGTVTTKQCGEPIAEGTDALATLTGEASECSVGRATGNAQNASASTQQSEVPLDDGMHCDRKALSCSALEKSVSSEKVLSTNTNLRVQLSPVAFASNTDADGSFAYPQAETSSIDYITSLLRRSTPVDETTPVISDTSKDSKPCTPFETPVESPDSIGAADAVVVSPVGFADPIIVTDAELEKYLKEAEDNEKLSSIKSNVASVGGENDANLHVLSERDADGLSSGDEFYSPILERSAFSRDVELMPDQTYEEAGSKRKEETTTTSCEPPSVTENDVCPSLATTHNKMVVMESQSTMAVCSTNTGTRPKISTDVDVGNLLLVAEGEKAANAQEAWQDRRVFHDAINRERAQRTKSTEVHMVKEQQNLEIKNQLQLGAQRNVFVGEDVAASREVQDVKLPDVEQDCRSPHPDRERISLTSECLDVVPNAALDGDDDDAATATADDDERCPSGEEPSDHAATANDGSRKQRPTSLNLMGKVDAVADQASEFDTLPKTEISGADASLAADGSGIPNDGIEAAAAAAEQVPPEQSIQDDSTSPMTAWTDMEAQVGKVAPFWIPDANAATCMQCNIKFTVIKRRHHCRACGRVLCGQCCAWRAKLQYMDNKEARVCQQCLHTLRKVQAVEQWSSPVASPLAPPSPLTPSSPTTLFPNPNNPNEYCSTVPPLQQVRTGASVPPPTVMVPVGVLKREGATKTRGEPKQVMFSDGIRPGGDLTELDSPTEPKPLYRRQKRIQKRVEKIGDSETSSSESSEGFNNKSHAAGTTLPSCLPHDFLPDSPSERFPLVVVGLRSCREYLFEENPDTEELFTHLQDKQAPPVMFAVNKNLFVHVKILTLDCCIKKTCWCFSTEGMGTVGQDELVILLECLPDEKIVPEDMFSHFNSVYDEASQGNPTVDMGHTLFTQSFLGSREHGGFLYVRPTFQCLNQLPLPPHPYLVGVLLQKWEMPWAKVFPLRLMLRLGSEFRFYPCPLVSIRFRKPVYAEIGHTIMNLLADFRNYQYKLPSIRGMVIHMEEKHTRINIPRNHYDEAMKALNNSNDHVLALGGNFSLDADSHLVCIQNDDGNYQTQAINIENKPRKVTGASFVVFNGALKSSSGLSAKSSIVEDGLMVQIPPDTMTALRQALREMRDFVVKCGPLTAEAPEEEVVVGWVEDDKSVNTGVKSPIDGMSMAGITSLYIHGGTDYVDQRLLIRWTEVFFVHADEENSGRRSEPINTSRLAEILAQACCMALTTHLKSLKEANLTKIGLRVTIDSENVGYEIGAQELKLPTEYMNDLDSELVPVIHRAASQTEDTSVTLELIFHVMEQ